MTSVQLELEFGQGFSLEYLEVLDLLFHIDLHIASKFQSTPFLCLLYFPMSKRSLKASYFFWKWGNANPNQITKSHIRNPLIQKVGFCKVLSLLEGYLDLILSPSTSLKIQIKGRNIVKKSVVQIPALEDQKKFTLFLFLFKSSIQNWIVCINYPSISCFKNQVSIKTNISYLISIEYNEISKNG